MRALWAVLAAILATLTSTAILGDLVSEEIRGRLDRLPHALIHLAARRVPSDVREDLTDEWTAELHEILRGAEALPVTRLYRGTRYGLGLLWAAPSIADEAGDTRRRFARLIEEHYVLVLGVASFVLLLGALVLLIASVGTYGILSIVEFIGFIALIGFGGFLNLMAATAYRLSHGMQEQTTIGLGRLGWWAPPPDSGTRGAAGGG